MCLSLSLLFDLNVHLTYTVMLVIKAKSNQYVKDGKIVLVYTVASSEKDAAKSKAEIAEYEEGD